MGRSLPLFITLTTTLTGKQETIDISGPRRQHAFLLQKNQSIQEGSEESDQFPIAKPHREVIALEPGNQAIATIATYIKDTIQSTPAPDVVPNALLVETSTWKSRGKSAWTGLTSYFGSGAPAEGRWRLRPR